MIKEKFVQVNIMTYWTYCCGLFFPPESLQDTAQNARKVLPMKVKIRAPYKNDPMLLFEKLQQYIYRSHAATSQRNLKQFKLFGSQYMI